MDADVTSVAYRVLCERTVENERVRERRGPAVWVAGETHTPFSPPPTTAGPRRGLVRDALVSTPRL